jgi:hypothetical protein
MSGPPKDQPGRKQAGNEQRRLRLAQALRANLLKRKVQAKNRARSAKDGDEGRQS